MKKYSEFLKRKQEGEYVHGRDMLKKTGEVQEILSRFKLDKMAQLTSKS